MRKNERGERKRYEGGRKKETRGSGKSSEIVMGLAWLGFACRIVRWAAWAGWLDLAVSLQ